MFAMEYSDIECTYCMFTMEYSDIECTYCMFTMEFSDIECADYEDDILVLGEKSGNVSIYQLKNQVTGRGGNKWFEMSSFQTFLFIRIPLSIIHVPQYLSLTQDLYHNTYITKSLSQYLYYKTFITIPILQNLYNNTYTTKPFPHTIQIYYIITLEEWLCFCDFYPY